MRGRSGRTRVLLGPSVDRSLVQALAEPVMAFVFALIVGGIGIAVFSGLVPGHPPFDLGLPIKAYSSLLNGLASDRGIVDTLVYATPLTLAGLGVAIGFRAGLFNIGGRGQFLFGSVGAVAVVTWIGAGASPWLTVPLALLVGALFGAFAGFIPGLLKATSGAHEVVTTIMLNYILLFVMAWAVLGPLALPNAPQPITVDVSTRNGALPILFGPDGLIGFGRGGHFGLLIALAAVPIMWFLLFRTTLGFEIRAAGANPDAARYGGMRTGLLTVLTMTLSGLMCGLAGATTLLGSTHEMTPGYDTTIGFDAITVALLGRSHPLGVGLAALLLGALRAGAATMQIQAGVPADLVDALQAIILLFLVVNVLRRMMARRQGSPDDREVAGTEVASADGGAA